MNHKFVCVGLVDCKSVVGAVGRVVPVAIGAHGQAAVGPHDRLGSERVVLPIDVGR